MPKTAGSQTPPEQKANAQSGSVTRVHRGRRAAGGNLMLKAGL